MLGLTPSARCAGDDPSPALVGRSIIALAAADTISAVRFGTWVEMRRVIERALCCNLALDFACYRALPTQGDIASSPSGREWTRLIKHSAAIRFLRSKYINQF